MATQLQEDLAEAIVRNKSLPKYKRMNKKDLVVSVGYSLKTAEGKAPEIINSKGVKDTLASFGLTEELITTALVDDIKNKPRKRFLEMSLGAEILGMKTRPKEEALPQNITNNLTQIIINPPYATEVRDKPNTEAVPSMASTSGS